MPNFKYHVALCFVCHVARSGALAVTVIAAVTHLLHATYNDFAHHWAVDCHRNVRC